MNNRRDFFAAGAAVGLVAAAPLAGAANATTPRAAGLPSLAAFEALVGQPISVAGSGPLTLHAVRSLDELEPKLSQFVLVLGSPAVKALPGSLQTLHHPQTGRFTLALQPSGRDERGHLYRAEIATLA